MKIEKHKVVTISYKMSDEEGNVLDSSEENGVLPYIHGTSFLAPGFEAQLEGKTVGDKIDAHIPSKDAFGDYDEDLVFSVKRKDMNISDDELEEGLEFEAEIHGEIRYCQVESIEGDTVIIDANHPLSDLDIHFEAEVIAIRDASQEELDHGHVHDEHGHHHEH